MSSYIDDVFGPGGVFDTELDNYEMRPGQVELARAFDRAINEKRDLVAEGPTGSGKTFAYSVAAIKFAHDNKEKVVIATAGIALQEQLISKDLPFLARVLPWKFSYGLLKGRSNYLCRIKHEKLIGQLAPRWANPAYDWEQPHPYTNHMDAVRSYMEWVAKTTSGDRSDLDIEFGLWGRASSSADECLGGVCPNKDRCFANIARRTAVRSDIIVMNYHICFVGEGANMPDHSVMICDEAHEIPHIARDFLGWTLTPSLINRISAWMRRKAPRSSQDSVLAKEWTRTEQNIIRFTGAFFEAVSNKIKNREIHRLYTGGWVDAAPLSAALQAACHLCESRAADFKLQGAAVAAKRATQIEKFACILSIHVQQAAEVDEPNWIYWLTQNKEKGWYGVEARPLRVGELLEGILFNKRSTGLISATMTTGGSFGFVREEIGVPEEAGEIIAPSPFDLAKQGILIIPSDITAPPKSGDHRAMVTWQAEVAGCAASLIEMCGGRTLLLFTSWQNLNYVARALRTFKHLDGFRIMKQGDMPRTKLLEEFENDEKSVLLGVDSFRTGVNVPGRALTGLLLDKIPFPVPTDPINKAMEEYLIANGRNSFMEYTVPRATIALRQGTGRLIRSRTDIGVVVITDRRLLDQPYGTSIRKSLPPFRTSSDLEDGYAFMEAQGWV